MTTAPTRRVAPAATLVIVNERAGGGAMSDRFRRIEHALFDRIGDYEIAFTDRHGHATELTRKALEAGADRVLVAGGDGTVNEAVNGFFGADGRPVRPEACLGLLAGGTGGDLRKTLRIRDMDEALAAVEEGYTQTVDVGRVTFRASADGREVSRYFLNIASFGVSGLVVRQISALRGLPGALAYGAATALSLWSWKNPRVKLTVDDTFEAELPVTTVAVCNGRFFGGGMKFAPDAQMDDGEFEVVALADFTRLELLAMARTVYDGGHVFDPKVIVRKGRVVTATPIRAGGHDPAVLLDIDGEALGQLPARFEIVPSALRLIVPRA